MNKAQLKRLKELEKESEPLGPPPVRATIGDGPEFAAEKVRSWITAIGAKTAFIEPGSAWETSFAAALGPVARCAAQCERCNARLRDELLNGIRHRHSDRWRDVTHSSTRFARPGS